MPLPTGPIPLVATGEIIEENWGDSVAQSLNNLTQLFDQAVWSPAGGESFLADASGLMTVWFTVGGTTPIEITVPEWATRALVTYQISGINQDPTSAGRVSYLMQAQVGPVAGTGRLVRMSGRAGYFQVSWTDFLDVDPLAGDRTVKIKAQRIEGTGAERWKLFDQSDVAVWLMFSRAINWYPGL